VKQPIDFSEQRGGCWRTQCVEPIHRPSDSFRRRSTDQISQLLPVEFRKLIAHQEDQSSSDWSEKGAASKYSREVRDRMSGRKIARRDLRCIHPQRSACC